MQRRTMETRTRWVAGSWLAGRDLRDAAAYEEAMQALHVGQVHGTWGIVEGLVVTAALGAREVTVGRGNAYTCDGHRIELAEALPLAVPSPPPCAAGFADFDLVVSRAEAAPGPFLHGAERCPPARPQQPVLRWVFAGCRAVLQRRPLAPGVRLGHDVPLFRISLDGTGVIRATDPRERRLARRMARPLMAGGVVDGASLDWSAGTWGGVQAVVDTSGAGFSVAPTYLVGHLDAGHQSSALGSALVGVRSPAHDRFTLTFALAHPVGTMVVMTEALDQARRTQFRWLAAEGQVGCPLYALVLVPPVVILTAGPNP